MHAYPPLKATMLSAHRNNAHDPPPCSFMSAEEAQLQLPKTPTGLPILSPIMGTP